MRKFVKSEPAAAIRIATISCRGTRHEIVAPHYQTGNAYNMNEILAKSQKYNLNALFVKRALNQYACFDAALMSCLFV